MKTKHPLPTLSNSVDTGLHSDAGFSVCSTLDQTVVLSSYLLHAADDQDDDLFDDRDRDPDDDDKPAPDDVALVGMCAPYEIVSRPLALSQRVLFRRGCFADSLSNSNDIACLHCNQSGQVFGRTLSCTLAVYDTHLGLRFEVLPPRTSWADDVLVSIQRNDCDGAGVNATLLKTHCEMLYTGPGITKEKVLVVDKAQLRWINITPFSEFAGTSTTAQFKANRQKQLAQYSGNTNVSNNPGQYDREFVASIGVTR
jgi:phage head maturation protease